MGDFSAHFHRPESGIHTVEGNVAGSRAAALTKKRQRQQEEFAEKERQIRSKTSQALQKTDQKFQQHSSLSAAEEAFRSKTVGLVTAEEFRRAAEEQAQGGPALEEQEGKGKSELTEEERVRQEKNRKKEKRKKLREKKKQLSTLSFAGDEEVEFEMQEDESDEAKKTSLKDPTVDTTFLPDKDREERHLQERKRLEQEFQARQQQMKEEPLEITYSYWDGSGHRRQVICKKGDTIGAFLELVRKDLSREFREMQNVSSDALLYVKEDLILPHDLTFYDLIATKARGKSGPLFHFDVHEDVRVGAIDSRVEKDESHPGKVVERRWYDRNKHIFPASRWEVFDPAKEYGTYTIHGGEVNKKK
jgi:protein FAM50